MSELEFKKFDYSTSLNEQRELFADCFPEAILEKGNSEHYKWKFHSFPNEKPSYEYAAYYDHKMVGYYAAIPYQYSIDGKKSTCGMVCDVMTHSSMRGKGVFTKIGNFSTNEMKEQKLDFVSGYPIRPEVIPGHLKVGWKVAFSLPIYLRVLNSKSILKSKQIGFLSPLVNLVLSLMNLLVFNRVSSKKSIRFSVTNDTDFFDTPRYLDFFENWKKTQNKYLIKSSNFMKWRLGASNSEYLIITMEEGEKILGLCIAKKTDLDSIPSLALLDYMLPEEYLSLSKYFLKEIKIIAKDNSCEVIATMMSPYWKKKYSLGKQFFLKSPFVFSLILKKLNIQDPNNTFFNENAWHLMWIDSDDL